MHYLCINYMHFNIVIHTIMPNLLNYCYLVSRIF
jgi:hypothetical protein